MKRRRHEERIEAANAAFAPISEPAAEDFKQLTADDDPPDGEG